MLDNRTCWICC